MQATKEVTRNAHVILAQEAVSSWVRDASCRPMTLWSEVSFPAADSTPQTIHERVHTSVFTTLISVLRSKHFLKVNHATFPKICPPTVCPTVQRVSFYYSVPTKCLKFEATWNINFSFIGYIKKFDSMISCRSSVPVQSTLKEVIRSLNFSYHTYTHTHTHTHTHIYIYIYTGCIKMIGTVSICHYDFQNVHRSKFPI